jgi:ankyrin repeat protein
VPAPPTRTLRERPNLDQLKLQAKDLLRAYLAGDAAAIAEVQAHYGRPGAALALHDAQLVIARAYGFASWPKLKAFVDGVTVRRLVEAVRADDLARVRTMLDARPELVEMDMSYSDEHQALHYAVLDRLPEMVRLLMQRGANPHRGIHPRRDATTALAFARDRELAEIVAIIEEESGRRAPASSGDADVDRPSGDALEDAVERGDLACVRARYAEGTLTNRISDSGGLLTLAARRDRPEMLELLLELGLDPDERTRVAGLEEVILSSGMPLMQCASTGRLAMAELLLRHGADPNAHVFASGTPVGRAYVKRDWDMVKLLQRHGGIVYANIAGYYRHTALAKEMFDAEAAGRLAEGVVERGRTLAENLLDAAASGGDPAIVRMALERIDWPPEDTRWYSMLSDPLAFWNHIPWLSDVAHPELPRDTYITCFRQILERCDANARGSFARTILHDAAASYDWIAPEERLEFVAALLESGARLDVRDDLLKSTPLGWACRYGRAEIARLLLDRGADPLEADAEPWATPRAWAGKMGHREIAALLGSS